MKKLLMWILILLLVFGAGCSEKDTASPKQDTAEEREPFLVEKDESG